MKTIILFNLASFFFLNFAVAIETDTHPQICENMREQLSENCSEESNTFDKKTGTYIKRTYEECYQQSLTFTLVRLNKYLADELGIYPYDASGEKDQIECLVSE